MEHFCEMGQWVNPYISKVNLRVKNKCKNIFKSFTLFQLKKLCSNKSVSAKSFNSNQVPTFF